MRGPHRQSEPRSSRASSAAGPPAAAAIVIAAFTAALAAAAPAQPETPFAVFVRAAETADAELRAQLEAAAAEASERIARRRRWFRVAADPAEAAVTLEIVRYAVGTAIAPRLTQQSSGRGSASMMESQQIVEIHNVDALFTVGSIRRSFYGSRAREAPTRLRDAADDLAEALEEFARENYEALVSASASPPPSPR